MLDAVMQVGVNDFLREGLDRPAGGDELREDLGAVPVGFEHPFHAIELSDDFPQAGLECFRIRLGVMMDVRFWHSEAA